MIKVVTLLAVSLFALSAQAVEPSAESINRLLDLMQSRQSFDAMRAQVESMTKPMLDQAMDRKSLSPEKREAQERQRIIVAERMKPILAETMNWDRIRADTAQIYTESFSQDEIDGLILFYESPAGKAFTAKMPLIAQKTMVLMQQRMGPMMEKIQQVAKESAEEFNAK